MKFKIGKIEIIILLLVVTYFMLDILDITQYWIFNSINVELFGSIMGSLFIVLLTVYYTYSFFKIETEVNYDFENQRMILEFYDRKLIISKNLMYKYNELSKFAADNLVHNVTPPDLCYNGVYIFGLGEKNIVFVRKNIFLFEYSDNRGELPYKGSIVIDSLYRNKLLEISLVIDKNMQDLMFIYANLHAGGTYYKKYKELLDTFTNISEQINIVLTDGTKVLNVVDKFKNYKKDEDSEILDVFINVVSRTNELYNELNIDDVYIVNNDSEIIEIDFYTSIKNSIKNFSYSDK